MSRYAVRIVSPVGYIHSQAFTEVADAVREGLRDLGHEITPDGQPIIFGPALLMSAPAPNAILYNLEQVPDLVSDLDKDQGWFGPRLIDLFKRFEVWDYSQQNIDRLAARGIKAKLVPIGYHPTLSRIIPALEQDIDVLFYGSVNMRRAKVLDGLVARGLNVKSVFGVYGAKRDDLIARSKVVLNLHFYNAQVFEIVRCAYLLANRVAVMSETPVAPGLEHGICWADYDELVDICTNLVKNDRLRAMVAADGYADFRNMPVTVSLRHVLSPNHTVDDPDYGF
jgi:hypothetical protein